MSRVRVFILLPKNQVVRLGFLIKYPMKENKMEFYRSAAVSYFGVFACIYLSGMMMVARVFETNMMGCM